MVRKSSESSTIVIISYQNILSVLCWSEARKWPQKAMGKKTKESLVKLGSSEERGDHPVALMISEVFTLSLMET